MRTDLVADAVKAAAATRGSLAGAIFHTDHGAQYTSREFAEPCAQLGVSQSLGTVGTSADNSAAESFNATLKRETLQGAHRYDNAATCRLAVFHWSNRYNTTRRHSTAARMSPIDYEHATSATITLAV